MILELLANGDMLDNAFLTGLITEGEFLLLSNILANYRVYERTMKEAVKKGIITDDDEKKLREIRMNIYRNALRVAMKKPIAEPEKNILGVLKKSLGLDGQIMSQIEADVKRELKV